MGKVRVSEMAKEYGLKPAEFIAKLAKIGIKGKKSMSGLETEEIEKIKAEVKNISKMKPPVEEAPLSPRIILRKKPAVIEPEKIETVLEEVTAKEPEAEEVKDTEPEKGVKKEKPPVVVDEKREAEEAAEKVEQAQVSKPSVIKPVEVKIEEKETKKGKEEGKLKDSFLRDKKAKKILTKEFSKKSILMEIESSKALESTELETIHTIEPEKIPLERKKTFQRRNVYQRKYYRFKPGQKGFKPAEAKEEAAAVKPAKKLVKIEGVISLGELAHRMGVKASEVIKKLFSMGTAATINQILDFETALIIGNEFEYEIENTEVSLESLTEREEDNPEDLKPKPPIVTIMGHVDHGKTSLLDAIRKTNVTAGEAGGITQHIGAYEVSLEKGKVVFLDTPGHEAFTQLRARGAKVTDIVVLVVAADDGVMPQTIEAINHAKAAKVPIVVAINKIDKPNADPLKVKQALTEYSLVPEEWGGDTLFAEVSAKKNVGIKELLELILLQSEILELKVNPSKKARGTIIESKLDKGRGPIATVLIQEGTLKIGDNFVTGTISGRIRAMINYKGQRITKAAPSTPVEVFGLSTVPDAGNLFIVVDDERKAKHIAALRMLKSREFELAKTSRLSLEELYTKIQAGDVKELNIVLKADVQGSAEALQESLTKLSTSAVKLNVIHSSVGGVTESDVMLAAASNAIIIGFNVRPEVKASILAEKEKVDVRFYTIIYEAVDDVKKAMEGLLAPTVKEKIIGRAEVRNTFNIPKAGTIAGCMVLDGKVLRNTFVRLLRDNIVVHQGKIGSLKRFKEDAKEVQFGYECGIGIENYNDIKNGDIIEVYVLEQTVTRL